MPTKNQSFDNMANAINKRIAKIAEKYGTQSRYYEKYINQLKIDNVAMRQNKNGVWQISRGKGYNKYQAARVKHLYEKGETTVTIRKKYMKSHPEQKYKPREIDSAIKKQEKRQKLIDDTLDTLYKYFTENILPTDIVDMYDNFRQHDTSNDEIDTMISRVSEFDRLHGDILQLENDIKNIDYTPIDIMQDMWEITNARLSLDELKNTMKRVREWIDDDVQDE